MEIEKRLLMVQVTREVLQAVEARLPGMHIVIVVTDESGDYVGVNANVTIPRVDAMLRCALSAPGKTDHPDATPRPALDDPRVKRDRTSARKPKGVVHEAKVRKTRARKAR